MTQTEIPPELQELGKELDRILAKFIAEHRETIRYALSYRIERALMDQELEEIHAEREGRAPDPAKRVSDETIGVRRALAQFRYDIRLARKGIMSDDLLIPGPRNTRHTFSCSTGKCRIPLDVRFDMVCPHCRALVCPGCGGCRC